MRSSSVASSVLVVGLVAGVALVGCGGGGGGNNFGGGAGTTGTAGATGTAGSTGVAGSTGTAGTVGGAGSTGSAGATGTAGSIGNAGTTGNAGSTGGAAGATGTAGVGAAGAGGGAAGAAAGGDITKVAPSAGCNMDPGPTGMQTIMTSGTKDADCADKLNNVKKCGAWSVQRTYYINLPGGYDKTKPYPLLFEGPGCGGGGNNLYNNPALAAMVIRIGMSPPPNSVGHGTNENQGCFDDKEGDDSVDWPFYTAVWDKLATTLCFDKNRVFAGGNSSGAWFSNEVGCKFAGDPVHPIRGIMPNTGGLPDQPMFKPTCTTNGMAGMWVHGTGDQTNPFTGNIYAMNRAIGVNGCPAGMTYANSIAAADPFPLGGDTTSCKRFKGCSPLFPMVVCPLNLNDHGGHESVVNPGWVAFLKLFQAAPLFTP
jgi:poly(3-hydroxybutyrate) depolymerase